MTITYCMTSNCPLALACLRFEDDVSQHSLTRTYADFSEELVHQGDQVSCPFYLDKAEPPTPNREPDTGGSH